MMEVWARGGKLEWRDVGMRGSWRASRFRALASCGMSDRTPDAAPYAGLGSGRILRGCDDRCDLEDLRRKCRSSHPVDPSRAPQNSDRGRKSGRIPEFGGT